MFISVGKEGKKGAVYLSNREKIGEKAAVYNAEHLVIQETVLSLKIHGL